MGFLSVDAEKPGNETKRLAVATDGRSCLSRVSRHVWLAVSMLGLGSTLLDHSDKGRQEFCEMKASITLSMNTCIAEPKSTETSIKTFPKNALICRDGYVKKHSNKVWMALC